MLVLTCTCGNRMKVPDDAIGKAGKCSQCREVIKITAENTSTDSPAVAPKPAPTPARAPTSVKSSDPDRKRIGELMLDAELITEGQLKEALEMQRKKGGKIVEVLISLGYLSVDAFVNFLARQPGIASLDLANYQIPADTVALVSKEIAVKHEVFPIDKMGRLLTLAMACPLDSATISRIEQETGLRVKALLCSPNDIRTAINEYYPKDEAEASSESKESVEKDEPTPKKIESGLKLSGVIALVKKIKSLPAMPETVERVREAMDDLSISPSDVAETIEKDPPIVAQVLSVANSAAYGFPNRVDTIELAVALLGLREIYSIVMSAAVLNLFEKTRNFDYKVYWEEAMNCAAACRIIAACCGREKNTSVFTAGLLHDIGRIALLEIVPEKYLAISSELVGDELIEAEQAAIGIAHTEAGYELANNWNLPIEIAEPIRFHHHPEFGADAKDDVAIVALAELWTRTHALTEENREELLIASKPLFDMLGVDGNTATQAYNKVSALERVRFTWSGNKVA